MAAKFPNKSLLLLVAGVLLLLASAASYAWPRYIASSEIKWDVTVVGEDGKEKVITFADIKKMPYYIGKGGEFSSTGVVSGPYAVKGIPVTALCDLADGVKLGDVVLISAPDGYSQIYSYDEIQGKLITYDPANMKEVPYHELKLVLMYEQDGKPLTHNQGGPLRVATAGTENLLTEGHYWVMWVNRIEIAKQNK